MSEKFIKFREPEEEGFLDSEVVINKDEILTVLIYVPENIPPYTTEAGEQRQLSIYLKGDPDGEPSFSYRGDFAENLYDALLGCLDYTQILPEELP